MGLSAQALIAPEVWGKARILALAGINPNLGTPQAGDLRSGLHSPDLGTAEPRPDQKKVFPEMGENDRRVVEVDLSPLRTVNFLGARSVRIASPHLIPD